ncbi:uncharacterized protein ACIGJ3_007808 isoform 1-T1 [Trichechus inunguis]
MCCSSLPCHEEQFAGSAKGLSDPSVAKKSALTLKTAVPEAGLSLPTLVTSMRRKNRSQSPGWLIAMCLTLETSTSFCLNLAVKPAPDSW